MVGKTAAKCRVYLLDAVGDPERGHRVGLENLVDPGLAVDRAIHGGRHLLGARQQLRRLAGNGREHIFHLIEQQRRMGAALEEDLCDLQRAVAVAPAEGIAVAVGVFDLKQVEARGLRHHLGKLGLAGAGRAVKQHVDALLLARDRVAQQGHQHIGVFLHKGKIIQPQLAARCRAGEHSHQLVLVAVLAHQHGWQFFTDLHEVGEVGDVVFGDQVLDHAYAFKPRAGAQGLGHFGRLDTGHIGNRGIGFGRIVDLELDQQRPQVTLVTRKRAVEQQCAFGAVELQQVGQRINVFLDQGGLLFQRVREPFAGGTQYREQVLGLVLGVFVEVEKQRAFFIGAAPGAVTCKKFSITEGFVATPELVVLAAAAQELAQAQQRGQWPDKMPARQRQQTVEVAAHIELGALARGQGQHKMRAHQVQHRRLFKTR